MQIVHYQEEEGKRIKEASAKNRRSFVSAGIQTEVAAEKAYPAMKPTEDPITYVENFLAAHNHPDPGGVTLHLHELKGSAATAKREIGELTRKNRVLEKKLEDAVKTAEESKRKAGAAAVGPAPPPPAAAAALAAEQSTKVKQLEARLKESEASASALKQSLDNTAGVLSLTTAEAASLKSDLASEKMKSAGLAVLIKTKEKQLHRSEGRDDKVQVGSEE